LGKRGQDAVAIINAPGLSATGRAQKLRREISKLDGILEIDIDYRLDTISIKYDPRRIPLARIRKKVGTR
jgi:copper chaperone CopZ